MPVPDFADIDLLNRRKARAAGFPQRATYLLQAAAELVHERLDDVNRPFRSPLLVHADPAAPALFPGFRPVAFAETLEAAPGSADLVVHFFCLHWANDPVGQLVQSRLALMPDGLMLAMLPGGRTLAELRDAFALAEADIVGGATPRVAPMGDIRDLGALPGRAGFAMPVADRSDFRVFYPDLRALMLDLRSMGETNILSARSRAPMRRDVLARAEAAHLARSGRPDGGFDATFELVCLTGWAPAPGQPGPARPGSANVRLADALGVVERPAGEKAVPE